jgi:uncharacterized protein (TIGR00369 family)
MKKPVEGFTPHFRQSPVTDPWEPLFSRRVDGVIQIGMWVREVHCNSRGFLHGGVIAALADNAMGLSCVEFTGSKNQEMAKGAVTIGLSVDYTSPSQQGQWFQVEPRIVRVGRSTGFADALITADGNIIARASASFGMLR